MRAIACSLAGLGLLLSACAPSVELDPEDPEAVAAIDSIVQTAMKGSRAADANQVLAMAEGVDDLTFITGDLLLEGLETIRADFEDTYADIDSQWQEVFAKRIRLLTPDVALVTAVSEGTFTDLAGWTSEPVGMGHTLVFVRTGDGWRLHHAHQSIAF